MVQRDVPDAEDPQRPVVRVLGRDDGDVPPAQDLVEEPAAGGPDDLSGSRRDGNQAGSE